MNLFDSANYPTKEPAAIVAGDFVAWKRSDLGGDYDPASYTLKYSARLESTGAEIEITATGSGTDYLVEVASTVTATYGAGVYHWQAYIVRTADSARITVDSGTWEVKANRDSATTDPRSHAKKMLDAVEAALEAFSLGVKSYTINGRSMTKQDLPELLTLRSQYKFEVAQEQAAANGTNARHIGLRFRRV